MKNGDVSGRLIACHPLHDLRSSTKSIVGLLAGIVLARHPEYSIHTRVRDFPELKAKASLGSQDLELGDFLGMTSGLAWSEWGKSFLDSDETSLSGEADPLRRVLQRASVAAPGTVFNYSGGSLFVATRCWN